MTRGEKHTATDPGWSRPRACQRCRIGKTKCDMAKPTCKSCAVHSRRCIYSNLPPKPRPSRALVKAAEAHRRTLELLLIKIKQCRGEQKDDLIASFEVVGHSVRLIGTPVAEEAVPDESFQQVGSPQADRSRKELFEPYEISDDDEDEDTPLTEREVAQYLSLDEDGHINAFGPTSALHNPVESRETGDPSLQNLANQLFVNATLQRQFESTIWSFNDIDGVPIELATHLHDLHWNRQHHTFLLTYRPAYTRDLIAGGPYWSKFLSNAIFASVSKFSNRPEVRDDPTDPRTSGGRFLRRCEALLIEESPFDKSSIPTVVGLLLLGSAFLARGESSKSWKYYGLAIRMVFDLGLHLDCERPGLNAEDMEIRRRVFWGVFICDKLQSLYLGRPVAIQLRDAYVSCDLRDTLEEHEPWTPYIDPNDPRPEKQHLPFAPTPLHSVTTFQQLCELSKLMTKIVNRFYVAGARMLNAETKLRNLDQALNLWRSNLPQYLVFEPLPDSQGKSSRMVAPNIILINTTYQSLIILLHRPFISNSHLRRRTPSVTSWKKCTEAAKVITNIMTAYRSAYTLRGAPYLASYACYVACTIHVRNAVLENGKSAGSCTDREMLERTLVMLSELSESSPCTMRAIQIIRRLMETNRLQSSAVPASDASSSPAWDVDALVRMFPTAPSVHNFAIAPTDLSTLPELSQQQNLRMSEDPMLYDPLFGFMDGFDLQREYI